MILKARDRKLEKSYLNSPTPKKLIPEDKPDRNKPINVDGNIEQLNLISGDVKELIRKIIIDTGNYNDRITGDYIDRSRQLNNFGTINNSGAGSLNQGDINGTVANTINQLPNFDNEPAKQQLKQLLSQLKEAILEANFDEEEIAETLEQVQTIALSLTSSQDNTAQKTAKTAMKLLRGTAAALSPSAAMVTICNQLPDLINKIF